jgi:polyisoprenoid-binding protein YceI
MRYASWSLVVFILVVPGLTRSLGADPAPTVGAFSGISLQLLDGSIAVSCPLTVGGGFEAKTSALRGELVLDPAQDGAVLGDISVDLRTLQTGIGLRDSHMREKYLEVHRGQRFAAATLDRIRLEGIDTRRPAGKARFRGVLVLHGTERQVTGTAEIRTTDQGLRVQANFPVRVSEFEIPSPAYLGVGVRDDVTVTVTLKLGPKRQI